MIINQLIHCLRTLARLLSIESNRDSLSFVIRVARIHSNAVKGQLIPRGNHFFDDYTFACSSLSLSLLFLFIFFFVWYLRNVPRKIIFLYNLYGNEHS